MRIKRIAEMSKGEFDIALQVVEDVHKSLSAVSSIVEQGHQVMFAEQYVDIRLSGGGKIPMRHVSGTHEPDIYIKNPEFARPSERQSHS